MRNLQAVLFMLILVVPVLAARGATMELPQGLQARAQANPDLSGTWTLDEAKSDPAPAPVGRGGRGGGLPATQLAISQTPAEVTIAQGQQNLTYKLDGTETFYFQNGEIRATAAWDGGTLVVSWKRELFAGPTKGYITTTGKDSYSVAGTVLTIVKTTVAPEGAQTRKVVYNK
jgi:hypothetical protein